MSDYQLTPQAEADLTEIAAYLTREAGPGRAIRVLEEFRGEFRKLAEMPGMGHYRDDLLSRSYRFWSLYSYVIAYRWKPKPIEVIAIMHGARDLEAFFAQR